MNAFLFDDSSIGLYNGFVEQNHYATISQSFEWGVFQSRLPRRGKVYRVGVKKDGNIIAATSIVRHALPKGYSWLYSQGGPIGPYEDGFTEWFPVLSDFVKRIAREEKAIFWRISPQIPPVHRPLFKGFRKAHTQFQPSHTLKIDLSEDEDSILAQMKQKGRYNIRLASKKGVTVRINDGSNGDLERFHKILTTTAGRDGFSIHPFDYYHAMLNELAPHKKACLVLAEYEKRVIAGAILTFFGDTAVYYYGASSNAHRNLMAPYLVQWESIQEAKRRGFRWYDFLGVAPQYADKSHPWAGVTSFKEKFGGIRVSFLEEHERVFKKVAYHGMVALKKAKGLLRKSR